MLIECTKHFVDSILLLRLQQDYWQEKVKSNADELKKGNVFKINVWQRDARDILQSFCHAEKACRRLDRAQGQCMVFPTKKPSVGGDGIVGALSPAQDKSCQNRKCR